MLSPTLTFVIKKTYEKNTQYLARRTKDFYILTVFNTGISETPACFAAKMSFIQNTDSS